MQEGTGSGRPAGVHFHRKTRFADEKDQMPGLDLSLVPQATLT